MRTRWLCIRACSPLGPKLHSSTQCVHDILDSNTTYLSQVDNVNLLFVVFSALHYFSVVQQILKFATINLVERNSQLKVCIRVQQGNHVICRQQVHAWHGAVCWAHHSEGFATASLTIGEASGLSTFEGLYNERLHTSVVDLLVILICIKRIVKLEVVLLNEFCQVYFAPTRIINL